MKFSSLDFARNRKISLWLSLGSLRSGAKLIHIRNSSKELKKNFHSLAYSIECKNIEGGRNVYEMWSEICAYLGNDENEKAKIKMHFNRHLWLEENKSKLSRINASVGEYEISSMVVTPDEIPIAYLKKHELPLPIRSFTS